MYKMTEQTQQKKTEKSIIEELRNFNGTENYYLHFSGIKYTDGVQYLANECNCYWLIDLICSYQDKNIKTIPFQVWELNVNPNETAIATMKEDSGQPILIKQEIEYTDFPLKKISLWLIEGVLILPSEY